MTNGKRKRTECGDQGRKQIKIYEYYKPVKHCFNFGTVRRELEKCLGPYSVKEKRSPSRENLRMENKILQ